MAQVGLIRLIGLRTGRREILGGFERPKTSRSPSVRHIEERQLRLYAPVGGLFHHIGPQTRCRFLALSGHATHPVKCRPSGNSGHQASAGRRHFIGDEALDFRLYFGYIFERILAHVKDLPRRHTGAWERGRCPRAELQTAPGQLRASTSQHYRLGREVLAGLGQVRAGNARTNCVGSAPGRGIDYRIGAPPRPRKHGLELGLWEEISPGPEPRWNADRCAHPAGCAAVPAARQVGQCVCRRSASFSFSWRGEASVADSEKAGTTPSFSERALSLRTFTWRAFAKLGRVCAARTGALICPAFAGQEQRVCAQPPAC